MITSHADRIFAHAWAEHQHIRMLLGQVECLFGHLGQRPVDPSAAGLDALPTLGRMRALLEELRRNLALEGGNSEVAITLASHPGFDAQVTDVITHREVLERQIGKLTDDKVDVLAESQVAEMTDLFPRIARGLKEYLSTRMDLLRRSQLSDGAESVPWETVLPTEPAH